MQAQPDPDSCIGATTPDANDLLTEREVAEILRTSVMTLRGWRWKRIGPRHIRIGDRMVRYRRGDLNAFIETGVDAQEGAA